MEEEEIIKIGKSVLEGQFDDILTLPEVKIKLITQEQAIHLMICCCTFCHKHCEVLDKQEAQLPEVQDVIHLVKVICKRISNTSEKEYTKYLQSMFFISKLVIKKDFKLILLLEQEILPKFLPKTLSDEQKGIFKSLCAVIRNGLVDVVREKKKIEEDILISIGCSMTKIIVNSMNHSLLSECIFNVGACLVNANIPLKKQYNYFLFNIHVLENDSLQISDFSQFIHYGMLLVSLILKEKQIDEARVCFEKLYGILPENYEFKRILRIWCLLLDTTSNIQQLKDCRESLRKYVTIKNNHTYRATYLMITSYCNISKNNSTSEYFGSKEKQFEVHTIINDMIRISTNNFKCCGTTCDCSSSKRLMESTALATAAMDLFSSFLTLEGIELMDTVSKNLENYCNFLVSLKMNNCDKWYSYWSDIAVHMYNLGVQLSRNGNNERLISFCHIILKYHSTLEENFSDGIILLNTLSLMRSAYHKEKKYLDALTWCAVEIINNKGDSRYSCFNSFIRIKSEARDNEKTQDIQEFTVVSVIQLIPDVYRCYLSQLSDKKFQINLLIEELNVYQNKWKSKVPMMSAFRNLYKIADNCTLMNTIVKIFCIWGTPVHENVTHLMEKVFDEFEHSSNKPKEKNKMILLVFLHTFRYKNAITKIISKNVEEMKKKNEISKAPTHEIDTMPDDTDHECDVVSVYEGLKIDQMELKYLKKSLDELEKLLLNGDVPVEDVGLEKIYTLIKFIAFEFKIHCDLYHSLKAFYLGLSLAQRFENDNFILETGGNILSCFYNPSLEMEMERIALKIKNNVESYKYLFEYHVNLSNIHLVLHNISNSMQHFKMALEYSQNLSAKDNFWHGQVVLELLRYKLIEMSKITKTQIGMGSPYGPLYKAYELVVAKYCSAIEWSSYHMCLLFEVFETMIKMYHDLKFPREVRYFGKSVLSIAQQCVLPINSVKILRYLAHADFLCEKLDDCRVKLDGIAEILLMGNGQKCRMPYIRKERSPTSSVKDITEGINEIMLSAPNRPTFNINLSPSSPTHTSEPYKNPSFIKHKACNCFQCTSLDYHSLVLSHFHLEAVWYMHQKQVTLANSFFKGTLECYNLLTEKKTLIYENFKRFTNINGINNISKSIEYDSALEECKQKCLIDYVKFLYHSGAIDAAIKCNDNLISQLKPKKMYYSIVYYEALLFKLALLEKNRPVQIVKQEEQQTYEIDNSRFKTPEKTVPKLDKKANSPKMKRKLPSKIIKFNLTDDESEENNKRTIQTDKGKTPSKTPRNKNVPPSLRICKTPGIQTPVNKNILKEISIYTDDNTSTFPEKEFLKDNVEKKRVHLSNRAEPSVLASGSSSSKLKTKTGIDMKDNLIDIKTKMLRTKLANKHSVETVKSETSVKDNGNKKGNEVVTRRSQRTRT